MSLSLQLKVPDKAQYIIKTLTKAGFEAFVVGGCVRDSLLGKEPMDWDITTSAKPEEVKALFAHTIDTGIQHGTVTVMVDREGFEVTTYRIDGKYDDGRHPVEVIFTPSLEEDLKRRDFTINAMAYNDAQGLVDLFHGMEDLEQGIIRCVGNPKERFSEDALRMMRGVRFAAQLGYVIEENTFEAIRELAPTIEKISAERVQTELVKLLTSSHPEYISLLYEAGITKVIFPEFDKAMVQEQKHPHHCFSVGQHSLVSMQHIRARKDLRLSMLLHDIGKPETVSVDKDGITHFYGHPKKSAEMARVIMRRLKFDNQTTYMVEKLVCYHDYCHQMTPTEKTVRRAINKIGEDAFPAIFEVQYADIMAQSDYKREEKLANLKKWEDLYQQVMEKNQCVSLKTLAVDGKDLIALGVTPGKQIGELLQELLEIVLEDPTQNEKGKLLAILEKKWK